MFSNWDEEVTALTSDQKIEALKRVIESVQSFALWVTVALAVVLVVAGLVVKFRFPEKMRAFALIAVGIVLGYALTLISVILYMQITRMAWKNEIDTNFWLLVGLFGYALVAVIANLFVALFAKKALKAVFWTYSREAEG